MAANRAPRVRRTEYGESRVRSDLPSLLREWCFSQWTGSVIHCVVRRSIANAIHRSSVAVVASLEPFQIPRLVPRAPFVAALVLACLPASEVAFAADVVTLTLKDHRFTPNEVSVSAGERFRIEVENRDTTPAEFESSDLRV